VFVQILGDIFDRATTSAFHSLDELGREGAGTCIVEPRETECF
jgi:hypothetical protein